MEFDKSKVFTVVNADEVKVGSKGYFADSLEYLKDKISNNRIDVLKEILDDRYSRRFHGKWADATYQLFYLVEEPEKPEEKKYRPYKDTNEMIADFLERYNNYSGASNCHNPMYNPLIWIKEKFDYERSYSPNSKWLIVTFDCLKVWLYDANDSYTMEELFERFTYLDDSPCGKLEE